MADLQSLYTNIQKVYLYKSVGKRVDKKEDRASEQIMMHPVLHYSNSICFLLTTPKNVIVYFYT